MPEVEHEESGAAEELLHPPSPACTPGAANPGECQGWGDGGSAYVLPVTEGAGQHAARVEPYAGLRTKKSQVTYTNQERHVYTMRGCGDSPQNK